MPMGRGTATWRDVHVNDAKASIGLFPCHGDGVGIADHADVRKVIGLRQREIAFRVVRWDCGRHFVSPLVILCFATASFDAHARGAFSRLLYRDGISQAAFFLRRNVATIIM